MNRLIFTFGKPDKKLNSGSILSDLLTLAGSSMGTYDE
jgi:hypothetical protein